MHNEIHPGLTVLVPNARAANPNLYPNESAPKQSSLYCSPAPIHGLETGYFSSFILLDPSTGREVPLPHPLDKLQPLEQEQLIQLPHPR